MTANRRCFVTNSHDSFSIRILACTYQIEAIFLVQLRSTLFISVLIIRNYRYSRFCYKLQCRVTFEF
jgi:hypothetical protein